MLVGDAAAKLSMGVRARTGSTCSLLKFLVFFYVVMMQAEVVLWMERSSCLPPVPALLLDCQRESFRNE